MLILTSYFQRAVATAVIHDEHLQRIHALVHQKRIQTITEIQLHVVRRNDKC